MQAIQSKVGPDQSNDPHKKHAVLLFLALFFNACLVRVAKYYMGKKKCELLLCV